MIIGKAETEFRGQRMLQLVVTKGHIILKVTEVPFLAGASVATALNVTKFGEWLAKILLKLGMRYQLEMKSVCC